MKMLRGASMSAIISSMFGSKEYKNGSYGLSHYQPARRVGPKIETGAGMRRAAKRLKDHMKQWDNTPKSTTVSRQVRRRQAMARI